MASFTITPLAGDSALVRGTDNSGVTGETKLDAREWNLFKMRDKHIAAHEEFDKAVTEFFKPLTDAAEAVSAVDKDKDPLYYEVLSDEVEAVEGQEEVRINLSRDSIILKAIETGETDRLVWVLGNLEVLDVIV